MAGQRLTDKTALAEQLAKDDLLMLVDVSDTTGSAEGTSKKIEAQYVITTDKVTLTNADVLALDTTPITLVPLKTGYMITPISVTVLCTYASPTEIARKDLLFGFNELIDTQFWAKVDAAMDTLTADATYILQGQDAPRSPSCSGTIKDLAFKVWSEGAGFGGGWACDIYITYAYTKNI